MSKKQPERVASDLHLAVIAKDLVKVRECLEKKANPNSLRDGCSPGYQAPPLILAAVNGDLDICKALVAAGAKPNATYNSGWCDGNTALHAATTPEVARYLVGVGADPNFKNEAGMSPLDTASPAKRDGIEQGMAAFEQQQLRANLPSVADEMRSQGLTQTRGRRL